MSRWRKRRCYLVSVVPWWPRKFKPYVFLLLKPYSISTWWQQHGKSPISLSEIFISLHIVVKYPAGFSSSWLFDHCRVEGRWEGGEGESDWWEVQIISSWSFATCGGQGSLTLHGWTTWKLLFLLVKKVTYQQFHMLQLVRQ